MKIKSVLIWPAEKNGGPCLGWHENCENKSEDTHHSEYAAKCICETLLLEGFGCEGRRNGIYPLEARVEVVNDKNETTVVYRCEHRKRPTIDNVDDASSVFPKFSGFKFPNVELYAPKGIGKGY